MQNELRAPRDGIDRAGRRSAPGQTDRGRRPAAGPRVSADARTGPTGRGRPDPGRERWRETLRAKALRGARRSGASRSRPRPGSRSATCTRRPTRPASTRTATSAGPGEYPFTRGVQPTMYRSRFWTMRQYAGLRHRRGDQPALPLPPRAGPDRPVGRLRPADPDGLRLGRAARRRARSAGSACRSPASPTWTSLLDGLPLGEVSTSMTINATAPILLALYVAAAEAQGVAARARSPARPRTTSSRSTSPAGPTSSRRGRRCAS